MKHSYTTELVREVAANSRSVRQLLLGLGLAPVGSNHKTIKKFCQTHDIDLTHFAGQGWSKGVQTPQRPLDDYLEQGAPINSYRLKNKLFREGVFEEKCVSCDLKEWLGGPIPLELDHINGDSNDNTLTNLRILCPNCHALTPTYRRKKRVVPTTGVEPVLRGF